MERLGKIALNNKREGGADLQQCSDGEEENIKKHGLVAKKVDVEASFYTFSTFRTTLLCHRAPFSVPLKVCREHGGQMVQRSLSLFLFIPHHLCLPSLYPRRLCLACGSNAIRQTQTKLLKVPQENADCPQQRRARSSANRSGFLFFLVFFFKKCLERPPLTCFFFLFLCVRVIIIQKLNVQQKKKQPKMHRGTKEQQL